MNAGNQAKIKLRGILAIILLFTLPMANLVKGATYYSIATGNWGSGSSWSLSSAGVAANAVPSSSDNVVIERGYTITMNTTSTCATLTIGSATTNGNLTFSTNQILTVTGDVSITASRGTLNMTNGGILNVGGNFSNLGTFTYGTGTLVMNGTNAQMIRAAAVNNLVINNTAGVSLLSPPSPADRLNVYGELALNAGEFILNGNHFALRKTSSSPITRVNGTIDASAPNSILRFSILNTNIVIPAGFSPKMIWRISSESSQFNSISFESDVLKVRQLNYSGGTNIFKNLWMADAFTINQYNTGNIAFTDALNSTLTLGDGTNQTTSVELLQPSGAVIPNLVLNCGTGTITLEINISVSKSLSLTQGTLNLSTFSLTMSSGAALTRGNGSISKAPILTTGNYNVVYNGNTDISSTPELFPTGGGGIENLTVSLTDDTKTISSSSSSIYNPSGNVSVTSGKLSLGNLTRMAPTKTLTTGDNGEVITNGRLLLQSNGTGSASIGTSRGTINGNVIVEVFIPAGRRAFRLLGNPFTKRMSLDSLIDDIHITGAGGTTNGFDPTTTNNPSAFAFNENTFNGTHNSG